MVALHVSFNPTTKVAHVDETTTVPSGFTNIGTFEHPDATYPDSYVIFHGVRDLLYFVKPGAPVNLGGKFPDNITDMASITIEYAGAPIVRSITATPSTLALSLATDVTNGKTVAFSPVPSNASLGTLSIKTAPATNRATATIANNVLTVKPVNVGSTEIVITNGANNVTVTVNITA